MANVKNASLREIIIDRCLQSRRGYSTQEIFDACNDALEMRGEEPVTAKNTIRNDFVAIQLRWHINIEEIREGRNKRYRYEDPNFSIFKNPLNPEEIDQLMQAVTLLRRFEGMPGFEWIDEMKAHVQNAVSSETKAVVGFDSNKLLKGMEFFTPLMKSITDEEAIVIRYRPYKFPKLIEDTVHPYYLKEYNNRWFLFALNSFGSISNFALDRIESIGKASAKYIPNTTIDFEHYFDNVVGVSVNPGMQPEHVTLLVCPEQLPYTLSKPIHQTQKLVDMKEDGSAVLSIDVATDSFELEQLLLSFGERIEILSPASLRDKICSRLKKNLNNYE